MFQKVLVASRGEIALRVLEACGELGLRTVAVYSSADRDSRHVRAADEAICIGPPDPARSYLNLRALLSAAELTGADAVHPGYGFLAESARFAQLVEELGLVWIGPGSATMRKMADKAEAREWARSARVPVLAGSSAPLADLEGVRRAADEIGYPVMLKATAGGGGRGLRIVEHADELEEQVSLARREARRAFGQDGLYLERYLESARHIEFQIFGDRAGRIVHLGERECSIQRRHQKLVEEAPSTALSPRQRLRMGEDAVRLASRVGYRNAGTVEFLLADDGTYAFLEMNTRIQVEHPVTEAISGLDLVKMQIVVAAGESIAVAATASPSADADPAGDSAADPMLGWPLRGHAIECRINAEHPETFVPSPGRITALYLPGGPGIRVDTHVYAGYRFPPYYDSLIAKLVAHGRTRDEAIGRMRRALDSFHLSGIETTAPLHRRLMADPDLIAGRLSTRFMDRFKYEPAGAAAAVGGELR